MESNSNNINLSNISFPVFKLTTRNPEREDSVLFYRTESFNKDTATYKENIKIIDDTSIPQSTLARRRMQLKSDGVNVYPIHTAVYFLGDFIKLSDPNVWWIDTLGNTFKYKKSTRAKLKFYKIEACYVLQGLGAVIKLQGLPMRFKVLFKPEEDKTWAGVLHWERNAVLYGLYDKFHPETWRKV